MFGTKMPFLCFAFSGLETHKKPLLGEIWTQKPHVTRSRLFPAGSGATSLGAGSVGPGHSLDILAENQCGLALIHVSSLILSWSTMALCSDFKNS